MCMLVLKDLSKVWPVAETVSTLFESILGNTILEERTQKALAKRHDHVRYDMHSSVETPDPPKCNCDEVDLGSFATGGSTPLGSYERPHPQTPGVTLFRELNPPLSRQSPQWDPILGPGNSSARTLPTTPFNGQFSLSATPPDFFQITRTSPNLPTSHWEDGQPDQLFTDATTFFPGLTFSPPQQEP